MDTRHGLINRNTVRNAWPYDKNFTDAFSLPNEGVEGYIEDATGKVLGILSDKTVVLEERSSPVSDDQIWLKGAMDANEWFTFTNPKSGKVLTATSTSTLSIESKPISSKILFHLQIQLKFLIFPCFVT